jgi:hypothetical protein
MATNAVEICQLALGNLGETKELASLGEQSKEAKACSRWYSTVRDLVFASYPWPFARRISALTAAPTEANLRWASMYALPPDFLAARYLLDPRGRVTSVPLPYAIEISSDGKTSLLGCDLTTATLVYTASFPTDNLVPLIPAAVVDALTWKLAARLVPALALKPDQIRACEDMYQRTVREAYAIAISTEPFEPLPDSELITVRG